MATSTAEAGAIDTAAYKAEDAAHEADVQVPLHHGRFRYVPSNDATAQVREYLKPKNDQPFLYVPQGFTQREPRYFDKILQALDVSLPNLVVVTAATEGTADEQLEKCYQVGVDPAHPHPIASTWTDPAHGKQVLVSKVQDLLQSTMESCAGVGAWVVPQVPRRRNGAAQMICQTANSSGAMCMGLVALGDDQDDADLSAAITSCMQPLGSPLRQVARIVHDPSVKDGAPCAQLTHLVFFASPHELKVWRDDLLAAVPDFMLAFGDLTPLAFDSIFESVVAGSPVVLLKHTSPDIDNLCRMFHHAKMFFATCEQGAIAVDGGTTSGAMVKSDKPGRMRLPPMPDMDDERIKLFISRWPLDYNTKTIFCADPLLVSPSLYQKKSLAAISAAFDLKTGSTDFRKLRQQALDYCWSFHSIAQIHSSLKKKSNESLHFQLVTFTLISVIASVVYDQLYNGSRDPKGSTIQMVIFVSTILLPLFVTSLKQETDSNNPVTKWSAFRGATAKLESEISKFRCQVGPYRAEEKTEAAMRQTITTFTARVRDIWLHVKKYLSDDAMDIPEDFWRNGSAMAGVVEEFGGPKLPVPSSVGAGVAKGNGHTADSSLLVSEGTPLLADIPVHADESEEDDEEDPDDVPIANDNYTPLRVEDYLEVRMNKSMNHAVADLDAMVSTNKKIGNLIKAVTVLSGGAAALSLQWTVPIILGVTTALGSSQEFYRYPKRIELANQLVVRMNDLRLWWMGLSMYEQQMPKNKDRFVNESEKIILFRTLSEFGGTEDDL